MQLTRRPLQRWESVDYLPGRRPIIVVHGNIVVVVRVIIQQRVKLPTLLQSLGEDRRAAHGVPRQSMRLPHRDVQGLHHAVGVTDGAVLLQELGVVLGVDEVRLKLPEHREALKLLGVAQLGLERHPRPPPQETAEGFVDGGAERFGGRSSDGHHLVESPRETPLIGGRVPLERHRDGGVGQERYVHGPDARRGGHGAGSGHRRGWIEGRRAAVARVRW